MNRAVNYRYLTLETMKDTPFKVIRMDGVPAETVLPPGVRMVIYGNLTSDRKLTPAPKEAQ